MSKRAATVRVKRGARWLDENFPGWESRINPETLSLSDGQQCICGQVFREEVSTEEFGYNFAERNLFGEANSWVSTLVPKGEPHRAVQVASTLGFMNGYGPNGRSSGMTDEEYVTFDELQEAWVALLAKRAQS